MKNQLRSTGSKPMGIRGKIAGRLMNLIHRNQYKKIIQKTLSGLTAYKNIKVLDIGCGGGCAIKLFCAARKDIKAYGVDLSADMVALSEKVNKKFIMSGRAGIICGDAIALPDFGWKFDIVTAFDTINFWPDIEKTINEIKRILKVTGILLIVNGYPEENTKWWDFVQFKTDAEYRRMLEKNGFADIDIKIKKRTIIIKAYKK